MQVEFSTDLVFRQQQELALLYPSLVRTALHTVKPEEVATFLGCKLTAHYEDEVGNNFPVRLEGNRIKPHRGPASIKLYDKGGLLLRIEPTANDVSFFKHYREVEHRDGKRELKLAPLKKTIYSLTTLRSMMAASNRRYLKFISAFDDPSEGIRKLKKVAESIRSDQHSFRGLNFFQAGDEQLLTAISRGEFAIHGFQNKQVLQ